MNNNVLDNYALDSIVDDGDHLDWSWIPDSDIYDASLEDECDDEHDDE